MLVKLLISGTNKEKKNFLGIREYFLIPLSLAA
jgi:hypothetical protein